MNALRAIQDEPIPGYRLLEPLGRGGFGEVWKCEAPGGLIKALKFVQGTEDELTTSGNGAVQELRALQHIKSIRHPFLLSIERIEVVGQDLIMVMELADKSLHDVLEEVRSKGGSGLPRREVLGYLREAAEVLDLMNQEHGLQHLDVKPRNLFLVGRHIKLADFGLVNSLTELYGGSKDVLASLTPLYAAPETFQGQVTLFSDQYSLAVTYHELMTGEVPFKAKNVRQLALLVATTTPDLALLPEGDRPAVTRALSREPRDRFGSCAAFVEALEAAGPALSGSTPLPLASSGVFPVPQPRTTTFDLAISAMSATSVAGKGEPDKGSGLYRRSSRVVRAVRPAPAGDGPLPGYRLEECLGRGPTGEVWRGKGPRGDTRLVRFLTPPNPASYPPGEEPFDRLLGIQHKCLASLELIPVADERAALVSKVGDFTLLSRLKDCQAAGMTGIPRRELLGYLAQAADALDELYHLHQLQHLTLSPRHLTLTGNQVLLVDFGMAELLWLPDELQPATINPRYSAVELFEGLISDACDQYSLALLFQEMLVGLHPLRNINVRQMGSVKHRAQPDVSMLPAVDRPIMLQALSPEPEKRFRSCREFILALEAATHQVDQAAVVPSRGRTVPEEQRNGPGSPSRLVLPALTALPPKPATDQIKRDQAWRLAIEEHVGASRRGHEILATGAQFYRIEPSSHIEQRCCARLAPGFARLKMAGFREQWRAESTVCTETRFVMEVRASGSMLQRCLGRVPGVIVEVCLGSPRENASKLTPIRVNIQPSAGARGHVEQLLTATGPALLASLQSYLSTQADRSAQERFPCSQTINVQSPAGGQAFNATLRDIGRDGLCLYAPSPLPTGAVTLTINRLGSPVTVQIPGWVRDCYAGSDGRYEVEVSFGG